MFADLVSGWRKVFTGAGFIAPPQPGNTANAPADPAVQTGSYEYIIPQMFASQDIVNVPSIPSGFQDWSQYAVNGYGISGLDGGGATGLVPQIDNGPTLYFDETTGTYVTVNNGQ